MAYIKDDDGHIHRVHQDDEEVVDDSNNPSFRDRPVVIRRGGGGLGFLSGLLLLLVIGGILWATGVLDVNLRGHSNNNGAGLGGSIQLNNPNSQ